MDCLKRCRITRATRNMVAATLTTCFGMGTYFLAVSLQNVAITDSSDLPQTIGYVSGGVYFASSTVGSAVFPTIYNAVGMRVMYVISICLYLMFYLSMIYLRVWTIYLGAALAGAGGGFLWILSLKAIADNSAVATVSQHMGFFWAAIAVTNMITNLINYFYIQHLVTISVTVRIVVYGTLMGMDVVALLISMVGVREAKSTGVYAGARAQRKSVVVRNPALMDLAKEFGGNPNPVNGEAGSTPAENGLPINGQVDISPNVGAVEPGKNNTATADDSNKKNELTEKLKSKLSYYLTQARRRSIWLMIVYQAFSGFLWGFIFKALPSSIGVAFDKRSVINVAGLVNACSTLVGSLLVKKLRLVTNNAFVISFMTFLGLIAICLAFLIFPYDANINPESTARSYVEPEVYHIILIACLLSLTDTVFNVLGFSVVPLIFKGDNSTAYSFLNTAFSLSLSITMVISGFLNLRIYLGLFAAFTVATAFVYGVGLSKYVSRL